SAPNRDTGSPSFFDFSEASSRPSSQPPLTSKDTTAIRRPWSRPGAPQTCPNLWRDPLFFLASLLGAPARGMIGLRWHFYVKRNMWMARALRDDRMRMWRIRARIGGLLDFGEAWHQKSCVGVLERLNYFV